MNKIFLIGRITSNWNREYLYKYDVWDKDPMCCKTYFTLLSDAEDQISYFIKREVWFLFIEEFYTK